LWEATPGQSAIIGNKAAGLASLHQAGFRVPKGVCVTTDVHKAWRVDGLLPAEMRAELSRAFASLRVPVAVRSSSPAEDRADASFAGQYQTVLGVRTEDEFFAALEKCWRSASSTAALAYRKDQGAEVDVEMAVLVQELVPATSAGVLFTLHPVTDRVDQVVVNANFGLGESVVSGRAEPDTFILDKASGKIIESKLGAKRITSQQTEAGVAEVPTDVDRQQIFSLSEEQLRELSEVARKLEATYDMPMDAEWAFERNTLHMLQARPVTTGAEAYYTDLLDQWARDRKLEFDPDAVWARGSPLSGLPVSPLYYSEMAAFFSDMFPRVAELHGVMPGKRKSFRYYRGFTYSDVTFASVADPSGAIQPIGFFSPAWKSNLRLGLRYPFTLAFWANIDAYYRKWNSEWLPEIVARRPDYAIADTAAIRSFIEFIEKQRRERSIFAALGVAYAGHYLGLLAHLVSKWAPGMPDDTVGVLTSGVPNSLTHDENIDVGRLAGLAHRSQPVRNAILGRRYADLEKNAEGRRFLSEADAFRRNRPHRGCSDRDLLQPRWGDDREILLNQVNAMLSVGQKVDPESAHARTVAKRKRREQEVLEKVGSGPLGFFRRGIFRRVMREAQRFWIHRDNQRHSFDWYFYELRRAYRAMGDRLAQSGALSTRDHIFFAGKTEIYDYLAGKLDAKRLRARADWRSAWWDTVKELDPPAFLKGNLTYHPNVAGRKLSDGDLGGMGGAPGIAEGPVRLIRSLSELGSVIEGDILVTHAIDPAWTPVFGIIAGVISEEGGILSHATVLGREYGLPVVIGVAGATSTLRNGDRVEVNGTTGIVHRISATDNNLARTADAVEA
jgi:pyruvate,water dikinase